MTLDDYQREAMRTAGGALTDDTGTLAVATLGLTGEAGEVAELIKKHIGHGHDLDADRLAKELGDVLWYLARIATFAGLDLSDIAEGNLAKLRARYPDGFSNERSRNRAESEVSP